MKASRAWRWRPHGDRIGHHHHQPRLPQVQGEAERWPIMRGVRMELHVREADETTSKTAMVATLKLTRVFLDPVDHAHGRSNLHHGGQQVTR